MRNFRKSVYMTAFAEDPPPPGDCLKADAFISPTDTSASQDGTVWVDYTGCDGNPASLQYPDAGTYLGSLCVDPATSYAFYYFIDGEAFNAGSSGATITAESCP